MATQIQLRHPVSGLTKTGFYGFSWTTLFFGTFPALFRGDFITFIGGFIILMIIAFMTFGLGALLAMFIWAFLYNKYYTRKLIESGYQLHPGDPHYDEAKRRLGVAA